MKSNHTTKMSEEPKDQPPKKKGNKSLLTGMIVGGAVGSVLSLLFASKKSRETAKSLPKKAYQGGKGLAEKFLEKYQKAKEKKITPPEEKPEEK